VTVAEIFDVLLKDRPTFHASGTERWDASAGTLRAIRRLVSPGDRTIETGCGASTVIFAAQGAYHITISPNEEEHQRVRHYLSHIGVDLGRLTFVVGQSDLILPGLCTERTFDAALIDGDHMFPFPTIDWHYIAKGLKVGGHLVLDDIPMSAVASVFRHIRSNPSWRLEKILDERTAIFSLIQESVPEDYVLQQWFNRRFDYGFVPFYARPRLILQAEVPRILQRMAFRYPGLRRAWRRWRRLDL
jgi:predicted O-methyltransferase YrrM